MRSFTIRHVCLITFSLVFATHLHAQGCRLDYTSEYSLYVTATSGGSTIYTKVLTDGSTVGSPSAGCNYPNAKHTATSYSTIGSKNTSVSGAPGCMTCYLSAEDDEPIITGPGIIYTFTGSGEVLCTQFGTFFGNLFSLQLEIAGTHSKVTGSIPATGGNAICNTISWCTPATTPPDCNPNFILQAPIIAGGTATCSSFYDTAWLAERKSPASYGAAWSCYPTLPGENATGTSNGSQLACTYNK